MAYVTSEGINKTAWGAKLILMADMAYSVSCVSLGTTNLCARVHTYTLHRNNAHKQTDISVYMHTHTYKLTNYKCDLISEN